MRSYVEDSPAKTSVSQGKAQGSMEPEVDSGGSSTGLSGNQPRSGSSSKTSAPFAIEDWIEFSGRSLRSGMMRNGIVYPLQPSALLTKGTGSGSWPTPTANGSIRCSMKAAYKEAKRLHPQGRYTLATKMAEMVGPVNGFLNPVWIEWLMGFPLGWTELNNSETA